MAGSNEQESKCNREDSMQQKQVPRAYSVLVYFVCVNGRQAATEKGSIIEEVEGPLCHTDLISIWV